MDVNLKLVGSVLAVLASIAGIGSFLIPLINNPNYTKANNDPQPLNQITQTSSGANSPNIANVQGDVTLTINAGKSKLDIPSYDFSLQPFPGWRRDPELGTEFNKTMFAFLNQTIYLSVTLSEEMTKDVIEGEDEYGRIVFTVQDNADDSSYGGAEYLIHLSKNDTSPFEVRENIAVLSGYFKVFDINGPRQGYMSVNLRPVKID
ncbi:MULTISPECIES: hypothetical protein [Klebsiella]|uniref:Uncharacterized protein n=1 Tax=Klebsiella huaxiensis TaxID=2153354 RepID=A0A564KVT0_9ENTR|nr:MULTISPECIES: hypothetical protein [Klebsiella]VUS54516.1 hypothetical protein SB6419_00721 [Klebsiella spallanzanii]VUS73397.1 hypothetical protein SB6422_01903 [Klebsiella huaxiensis]